MAQPPRPGQPNLPPERSGTLIEGTVGQRPAPVERSGTVLETDEDLRQALLSGLHTRGQVPPAVAAPEPEPARAAPQAPGGRAALPYRPTARPPVALLTVFDDGRSDGEVIRLRDQKFVIGRAEGDLRIPIDGRMSARHVEITHQVVGGLHRWVVTDLQSTHGMFVRVSRTVLADKAEFLVGNGRYRFDAPQHVGEETVDHAPGGATTGETRGWDDGTSPLRPPALTELIGNEIGNRVLLVKPEYWIGSDPTCPVCRPDDPFCEPRHARIYRSTKGGWSAEHNKTPNGLWLRMTQITVDSMVQFQAGEQRFRLKVQ
jgi:hypothetical protein